MMHLDQAGSEKGGKGRPQRDKQKMWGSHGYHNILSLGYVNGRIRADDWGKNDCLRSSQMGKKIMQRLKQGGCALIFN